MLKKWVSRGGGVSVFCLFGMFGIFDAWLLLGFRPVDFTFRTLGSPDLGLSINGGARFMASELRCGWAGEGTRFRLLRPG